MARTKDSEQNKNKPNKGGNPAWVKGVSGNPGGRPKKGFTIGDVIRAKVTDSDWDQILDKAIEMAKEGDKPARDYLTVHRDGMPRQYNINENRNIDQGNYDGSNPEAFLNDQLSQTKG